MILLVHSCNSRSWIWEHWWKFFDRSGWDAQVRFIVGEDTFSDQLIKELSTIKDEYVWYTLDDYFIIKSIDWHKYEDAAVNLNADVIRVAPNVHFDSLPYRFEREGEYFRQTPQSEYHISMCTSLWRREYFLSCLIPGLDPWQLERQTPQQLGKAYFVPHLPFWYINGTVKSIYTKEGNDMLLNPDTYKHWLDKC